MQEEKFSRETRIGRVECLADGAVQVQLAHMLISSLNNVEPVEVSLSRYVLELDADLADQPPQVAAVCRAWWGQGAQTG